MRTIGIDIGTTSICGIAIDTLTGAVIESETIASNAFIKTESPWEKVQDAEKIIDIAMRIADKLVCSDTVAIGVTGQMHGIVYLDEDANAVSPLYTWQDSRAGLPYKNTTYAKYLGTSVGYGNATDFYNRKNGLVPEGAVTYCTIHDYFAMKLSGRTSPKLHASNAASFGLYNAEGKRFCYDYSPEIADDFEVLGYFRDIPVSVAIGDNQASVFSTLANEENILINIGTGSQVSLISDSPVSAEGIECRPYFNGKYLIVGAALCGGRAFAQLKNFFAEIFEKAGLQSVDVYVLLTDLIEDCSDTSLLVDTRFEGTRINPDITGSITNLTTQNFTPKDLTYGVLRGIIRELYDMYKQMGIEKHGLIGSGNCLRLNKKLMSISEELFGGKMLVPQHIEEAAFGAALHGLISAGYSNAEKAQKLIKYTE